MLDIKSEQKQPPVVREEGQSEAISILNNIKSDETLKKSQLCPLIATISYCKKRLYVVRYKQQGYIDIFAS